MNELPGNCIFLYACWLTGDKTGQVILDKAVETDPTGGERHARFGQSRQSRQDIRKWQLTTN